MTLEIDGHRISHDSPTYFIADIAANHDGSLARALDLIRLAKAAGADAAKFQHFKADRIVSDRGFRSLGRQLSHQAAWTKSVVEVYEEASVPTDWTPILKEECDRQGITFFSSPYDPDSVDALDPFVPAYKIGSGDIDWLEQVEHIARKGKPVILATGAASFDEVERAVAAVLRHNSAVAVLQCNTNYTADERNFDHLNLRVVETFRERWPSLVIGLSDHTHGLAAVLGAVALGARIIERHFTDDNHREGPDHKFALDPVAWRNMVAETRALERAMGTRQKTVAPNELEAAVVQRRSLRASRDLPEGHVLTRGDIDVLRPATPGSLRPADLDAVIGQVIASPLVRGQALERSLLKG